MKGVLRQEEARWMCCNHLRKDGSSQNGRKRMKKTGRRWTKLPRAKERAERLGSPKARAKAEEKEVAKDNRKEVEKAKEELTKEKGKDKKQERRSKRHLRVKGARNNHSRYVVISVASQATRQTPAGSDL